MTNETYTCKRCNAPYNPESVDISDPHTRCGRCGGRFFIQLAVAGESVESVVHTPSHYSLTGQAIKMLDRQTEAEHQVWNDKQMDPHRAVWEREQGVGYRDRQNGGPTYENGFQEWDD